MVEGDTTAWISAGLIYERRFTMMAYARNNRVSLAGMQGGMIGRDKHVPQ